MANVGRGKQFQRIGALAEEYQGKGLASSSSQLMAEIAAGVSGNNGRLEYVLNSAFDSEFATDRGGGMDHWSIGLGGLVRTEGRDGQLPFLTGHCVLRPSSVVILVIDSGSTRSSRAVLKKLREQEGLRPDAFANYRQAASELSQTVWLDLVARAGPTAETHEAINRGHSLLSELLGISTVGIDELRARLLGWGVPSLKLCGAGGGGVLVTVLKPDKAASLMEEALNEASERDSFTVRCFPPAIKGLQWEA